ncbi:FAD-binding oxidoreductase [Nocardioides dilutus]
MDTSYLRDRLAQHVAGEVYAATDPAAAAEVAAFNLSVTHRPAVVVAARAATDVAAAVRFARAAGLQVTVQATGHGAAAPAEDTVFVSTRHLQGLQVDPVARTARAEAGVRWRQVIDAAVPHGLAPLSGSSSGVGVVGYTLGGGMGHLARRHGFAADHVTSVELVTADGELRTVTAATDPELFWAVRGGQGSFGIVTAIEFDLLPVPRFFGGAMFFTGEGIEPVLRAFGRWAPTLPEEATTSVALLRLPPLDSVPPPLQGTVALSLRFGFTGSAEEGEVLLAPMTGLAQPVLGGFGPMPYAEVDRIHMDPPEPVPAVTRGALLSAMPGELVDALLAVAGPGVDVPLAVAEIRLMGGALGRQAAVPNAVAGRDGAFALTVVAPAPPPLATVAPAVAAQVVDALGAWSTGSQLVNFLGHGSHASPWPPEVLDRLRRVKAAVDPTDVFGGVVTASALTEAGAR